MQLVRLAALCLGLAAFAPRSSAAPAQPVPQTVVWFDLDVTDLARSRTFYGGLFGWSFEPGNVPGMEFDLIVANGHQIGTLNKATAPIATGAMSIYFPVVDIQASYDRAVALGAAAIFPPMPVPGGQEGEIAMFKDPDGHPLGLYMGPPLR